MKKFVSLVLAMVMMMAMMVPAMAATITVNSADNVSVAGKTLKAYTDETGDTESKAIVQGGGSYAKMVNNILCFGAEFPGEENTMHQANEKFNIESFMKMARVYARAIYSLCCE